FQRQDGALACDGIPLEEAAGRYGTPLYVYSRSAIEMAYAAYDQAFAAVPHRICYALKANGSGALLRILAELGAGADIVSGFELQAARRAGFPPERIVFSGVGKTAEEIDRGLEAGIGEFNAESEEELRRISAAASGRGRTVSVTLRVNPDIDPRSHAYISTGLRQNKFGVDIALAPEILGRARSLPGLSVSGVQCHIGSQITDLEPIQQAVRDLAALSRRLLSEGYPLRTIDIGGGLGVDYEGGSPLEPAALAARVRDGRLPRPRPEPGAGPAGRLAGRARRGRLRVRDGVQLQHAASRRRSARRGRLRPPHPPTRDLRRPDPHGALASVPVGLSTVDYLLGRHVVVAQGCGGGALEPSTVGNPRSIRFQPLTPLSRSGNAATRPNVLPGRLSSQDAGTR